MDEKIKIGISSCLLGENVRYNGGHAQDHYLTQTLGKFFEYVPRHSNQAETEFRIYHAKAK